MVPPARAIGVAFDQDVLLVVRNRDDGRPTFFDVTRAGGGAARRQIIEPGEQFGAIIGAGPAEVTLGHGLDYTIEVPSE